MLMSKAQHEVIELMYGVGMETRYSGWSSKYGKRYFVFHEAGTNMNRKHIMRNLGLSTSGVTNHLLTSCKRRFKDTRLLLFSMGSVLRNVHSCGSPLDVHRTGGG